MAHSPWPRVPITSLSTMDNLLAVVDKIGEGLRAKVQRITGRQLMQRVQP